MVWSLEYRVSTSGAGDLRAFGPHFVLVDMSLGLGYFATGSFRK